MREIKFRSYVEHTDSTGGSNNYAYMNYDVDFHGNINKIFERNGVKPLNPLHNKVTYMQFTGLKDVNGKEIYEGDIVSFYDLRNSDMTLKTGFIDFKNASFIIYSGYSSHYRWMDYLVEVLGNVYENKELLSDEN